jgi:hypothetical protein
MSWLPLSSLRATEAELQNIFDDWHDREVRCLETGAPDWLRSVDVPNERRMFRTPGGYADFCPDVLWPLADRTVVMELKLAAKAEPLALAQVSYYAFMLEEHPTNPAHYARPIVPVIVAQYNSWLRGALSFLHKKGLAPDAIHYLEVGLVSALREPFERVIWFDDPFAPWRPGKPPADMDEQRVAAYSHWYYVEKTGTWIGLNLSAHEETYFQKRPLFLDRPYAVVSQISQEPGAFVVFEGTPDSEGLCELFLQKDSEDTTRRSAYARSMRRRPAKAQEPGAVRPGTARSWAGLGRYKEWFAQHAQEYAGKWVALRDGGVVDSDPSRADLERRLEESQGLSGALFLQVGEPT